LGRLSSRTKIYSVPGKDLRKGEEKEVRLG